MAGWIPAAPVAGGEGPGVESQEERGSYLGMCSDGDGEAGRRLAGVSGGLPAVANGGGAPAARSGGERAGKLHESEGKPFPVLVGVEEGRKGVLHGELRAAAPAMACGGAAALTKDGLGASGRGDATASGAG